MKTQNTRTQKEILARIKEIENDDFFGATREDLVEFLAYDNAKKFLNDKATPQKWAKLQKPATRQVIIDSIANYMPFAWDKANACRGLSANRSIDHMRAYLWMLDDGSLEKMEDITYEHYGKELLIFVCDHVGLDWKQWDDGVRTNYG